ncbi:MAG: hypothetical protein L0215_00035 [Gemmataceae bacterium]|nr:hypothetical protein [Gemmataceae bacterium]
MVELIYLPAMLVMGVVALVNGRIKLSPRRSVEGRPARWIGAILLVPVPLALVVSISGIVALVTQDPNRLVVLIPFWLALVNYALLAAAVIIGVVIALFTSKPTGKAAGPVASEAEASPRGGTDSHQKLR